MKHISFDVPASSIIDAKGSESVYKKQQTMQDWK